MSRNDLILTLVRAGVAGDQSLLRSTVESLAATERAKRHNVQADRLLRAVQANGHATPRVLNGGTTTAKSGREFVVESFPQRPLTELALPETVRSEIEHLIEEHHGADLLRSHGLQPRHRVLLSGPPGNGKTALAESIAEALGLPLLTVRYEQLIGSFLGETTQRLGRMLDYVRGLPCVLFFDEFDVVGKERGDVHETGEIKRVVSSLLLQVDSLPSTVVVVTATNHAELLDRAVWRRFQLRLLLPPPSPADAVRILEQGFKSMPGMGDADPAAVASVLGPVSYAEIADFLIDLRRRHVLTLGKKRFAEVLAELMPLWAARSRVLANAERSSTASTQVRSRHRRRPGEGATNQNALPAKPQSRAAKASARSKVHRAAKGARGRSKPTSSEG
ncbi:MAG: AAA family ATPase [Hyphomicrobiaceae bacterium]